jgi:hypothetical protein
MKTLTGFKIVVIVLISSYAACAQGGWDVKYILIDSIDSDLINRAVKLDFITPDTSLHGHQRRWSYDTIILTIDKLPVHLVEIKGRGTDHYYFADEYLQSTTYESGSILRIYKWLIKELRKDSILFELTLQVYKKTKKREYELNPDNNINISMYSNDGDLRFFRLADSRPREIWIRKSRLDGVLIRTW